MNNEMTTVEKLSREDLLQRVALLTTENEQLQEQINQMQEEVNLRKSDGVFV